MVGWQKVTTAREKKQSRVYREHTCQTPHIALVRMTPLRHQVAEIKQAAMGLWFQSNLILKPSPGCSLDSVSHKSEQEGHRQEMIMCYLEVVIVWTPGLLLIFPDAWVFCILSKTMFVPLWFLRRLDPAWGLSLTQCDHRPSLWGQHLLATVSRTPRDCLRGLSLLLSGNQCVPDWMSLFYPFIV